MRFSKRHAVFLLCFFFSICYTTACTKERYIYSELSSSSVSELPEATEEIAVDPLESFRNLSFTPIGVAATFEDSDTGVSYSAKVLSVLQGSSLNDIEIGPECLDSYLFDVGHVSIGGDASDGYEFLAVKFEVELISDSSNLDQDDIRGLFTLSNSNIFDNSLNPNEIILAGFDQPEESKVPGDKSKYMIRIGEPGNTIECTIIYLVSDIDSVSLLSVAYGNTTIMYSLKEMQG